MQTNAPTAGAFLVRADIEVVSGELLETDDPFIRADFVVHAGERKLDESARAIDFVVSTEDLDSHCTVVDQSSWRLERFQKNPIVLFNHNTGPDSWLFGTGEKDVDRLPIARAENTRVDAGKLRSRAVFPPEGEDERCDKIWRAIVGKRLNCASVGFRPGRVEKDEGLSEAKGREIYRLFECELYEWSIVTIPSNPAAVAERTSRFLQRNAEMYHLPSPAITAERTQPAEPASLATPATTAPTGAPTTITGADVARSEAIMDAELIELLAKRFGCEKTEAAVRAALKSETDAELAALRDENKRLSARAATLDTVISALSLAEDATEADATRAVRDLTVKAGQLDEMRTELDVAKKKVGEVEKAQAEREVDWLLAHGKRYDTPVPKNARRALLSHRLSDPTGFGEDFAVALKGLREFDDTRLFDTATGGSKSDGINGTATVPAADTASRAGVDDFDLRVSAYMAKHPTLTRAEAMSEVFHGKDIVVAPAT